MLRFTSVGLVRLSSGWPAIEGGLLRNSDNVAPAQTICYIFTLLHFLLRFLFSTFLDQVKPAVIGFSLYASIGMVLEESPWALVAALLLLFLVVVHFHTHTHTAGCSS